MSLTGTAKDTLSIVAAGGYVAPSGAYRELRMGIDAAVAGTHLYRPGELDHLLGVSGSGPHPRIEVTAETTAGAAGRLVQAGSRVAALNFASAKNPGGGFLSGAKAQEEDLARCSALYSCLLTQHEYYDANRACESMLYTDHLIYSPTVPFFRDDTYELLERPYTCSIITAPAPNAGEALKRDANAGLAISSTLRRRAALILAVAAVENERNLILGAWGCGVFRNNPGEVAAVFGDLLKAPTFAGKFESVTFAVYDRSPQRSTLASFEGYFGGRV